MKNIKMYNCNLFYQIRNSKIILFIDVYYLLKSNLIKKALTKELKRSSEAEMKNNIKAFWFLLFENII